MSGVVKVSGAGEELVCLVSRVWVSSFLGIEGFPILLIGPGLVAWGQVLTALPAVRA